jgi:hypothetical protein
MISRRPVRLTLVTDLCVHPNGGADAFGQDVAQETADELTGGKRHPLVSGAAVGAIVLVAEGDAVLVERDQPAVGDGDAVGVARQIGEHRLGSAERGLCIGVPQSPNTYNIDAVEVYFSSGEVLIRLAVCREPTRTATNCLPLTE